MRRSFSCGNHVMGGANRGSTEFIKTVSRATATSSSVHEPFSINSGKAVKSGSSSSASAQSVSSSSGSTTPRNLPISAVSNPIMNYYRPSFPSPPSSVGDEFEWLAEDAGAIGTVDEFLFGPAPSVDEVQAAVSSLQQVIDPASFSRLVQFGYGSNGDSGASDHSSGGSEVDWIEPSAQMYTSRMLNSPGYSRVFDAFRLLQTDAAIQRLVVSLSSDRAVWKAVLDNEGVREFRGSLNPGVGDNSITSSVEQDSDGSSGASTLLSRIFANAKVKAMELFDVINKIVNNLLKSLECDEELPVCLPNPLEKKLRQSVMLTVMVLLIVVVTRGNTAGPRL